MGELSFKDLKAVLDDNTLDLNMRGIEKIPVKALMKLPRATHLDFSTNAIVDLPLSFGKLINLKWLDLKNNPLKSDLQKICGDCGDEKACKLAASAVVRYVKKKNDEQQDLIEKQNELNQRIENDTGLTQEDNSKKRKKRRKQQKKSQSQSQESEKLPEMNDEHKDSYSENRRNLPNKCKKRSFLLSISLAGTVLKLLILLFFGVFLYVSFVNCKRDGGPLIPLSEPFCKDLHILFTKYQNFQITATSAYSECRSIANNVWDNIQRGDYLKDAEELFYYVYGELSGAFFILQKYVNDALFIWFVNH
uniref:LRRCT domain-containing protein n=1 Tax=Syphacia muris TaxID=451379 RepID=A0A0N5AIU3_9BILA